MQFAPLHILLLEPYYGGSHQDFLTGLQQHVQADFTLLSLPARKWKMRMQLAAPWFAEQIIGLIEQGIHFDALLTSTFIDVAVLRSLLASHAVHLPVSVYFHENQFSYPGQVNDPTIFQFTSINFTSALCADRLAFNSNYNLESFLAGIRSYLKKATDMELAHLEKRIEEKSIVLYPGMDFQTIDTADTPKDLCKKPVIVWNHRWEHDKDPETFFTTLFALADGFDFRLIVLGQHFRFQPQIFPRAKEILADRIDYFGYATSKKEYAQLLKRANIIVSTAQHEFFGLAVLEAVRAGCRPLVPNRLSYKELFAEKYRYPDTDNGFQKALTQLLEKPDFLTTDAAKQLTKRFSWSAVARQYRQWLDPAVENQAK
jgi:glycosyltransferase involved in cell wall biosynthesis